MPKIVEKAKGWVRVLRATHPVVDHAARAYAHATDVLWTGLAGGVTYFCFLSLFPLLALAFAGLGYLTIVSSRIRDGVQQAILDAFPGLLGTGPHQINIDSIAGATTSAGIVGLVTFLWTGTGAVDAIRRALRVVFGTADDRPSLPMRKLRDLGVLTALGVLIVVSVAMSTAATGATNALLDLAGLEDSAAARVVVRVLAPAIALALDVLVLSLLFRTLSGREPTWRELRGGALLGGVAIEVLKLFATQLLSSTQGNPVYAGFAVVVGLLLWINFSARVLVFSACWVATEPTLLAAAPDAEAVHPAALPLVVAPGLPRPGPPRWMVRVAALGVLALAALRVAGVRRDAGPAAGRGRAAPR